MSPWSVQLLSEAVLEIDANLERGRSGLDLDSLAWGTGPPGTCQVGRLVRRPSGPPRQMLKEGVEWGRGPLAREGWLYSGQIICRTSEFLVTPLLMGQVRLISQGRYVEPVCSCSLVSSVR